MRLLEFADPILDFIKEQEQVYELSYGNCGVLAIALDQKFDMDQFIFVTNPAEPDKLYHVAAVKDGKIYDADGITNLANVRARGFDDAYPDEDPEVESVPAVESEYRYILQGTEPDIEIKNLLEHKMIWSRSGQKLKLKYRCASGPKAGRIVPDPKACSAPKDVAKAAQMKRTRATTKVRQARKAKKTKRVNPASKILARLNALTRPKAAPQTRAVRMTSTSTRKPVKPKK